MRSPSRSRVVEPLQDQADTPHPAGGIQARTRAAAARGPPGRRPRSRPRRRSPRRARRGGASRRRWPAAWIPDVSSQETVKLGPPMRNSRAIRLATTPPSEPIVRFADSAGPAASRSSSIQAASVGLGEIQSEVSLPLPGLRGQRPAQVEVGRVQVEPDPDQDARPRSQPRVPAGILDGLGRDPEHQRLLRQHLAQLLRRDAEPADRAAPASGCGDPLSEPSSAEDQLAECIIGLAATRPAPQCRRWRSARSSACRRSAWDADGPRRSAAVRIHSSIRTWALMPPKPNPLMAARRGWPGARAGQGSARVRTRNGLRSSPSCGLGRSKFGRRRQRAMLQGQEDLEQPGRAGRGERMADVRLDRADHALTGTPAGLAPERLEARDLDGIAARRAGGVAFDQVDVAGPPARLLVGRPHGPELTLGIGGHQVAVDVVGQADPGDDAVDVVADARSHRPAA